MALTAALPLLLAFALQEQPVATAQPPTAAEIGARIRAAWRPPPSSVRWLADGTGLEWRHDGVTYRHDFASGRTGAAPVAEAPADGARGDAGGGRRGGRGGPARGRQWTEAPAPVGGWTAFHRDGDLWLRAESGAERAITTDGGDGTRIQYATASWVYGEELGQNTAMWWSPDGARLAFYRFDESACLDYHLTLQQTQVQSALLVEAYPKAGAPNPIAELCILELASNEIVRVDARDGGAFDDASIGHYVYGVEWSRDGRELLFRRANRHQNAMELAAADPVSGACRVIVREEWPASWTTNTPEIRWLADGRRFLWASERSGWRNYFLYDLSGALIAPLTQHEFEVAGIVHVDEAAGQLWYRARSGDNPLKVQLHRVGLDGAGDVRLTDPALHHVVDVAPDGQRFTDFAQTHATPPQLILRDADGAQLALLAAGDLAGAEALGLRRIEVFTFPAADGVTPLWGALHFPPDFDPARRWPLLVSVYAGPGSGGASEAFSLPSPLTEHGFLYATLDSRSAGGRGKRALDAIYGRLGVVEVDDQAAGVRALAARPYVDGARVGIFGTSYGGYVSAMALLRHPEVFAAACASSAVTDWRNYDTIYTERYMGLPQDNAAGYAAGSAMSYAAALRGRLMIYYGTADDNVHPSNALQLIAALHAAGKSFEVQVGPDRGHGSLGQERMLEFFRAALAPR